MRIGVRLAALAGFLVASATAGVLAAASLTPLVVVSSDGIKGGLGAYFSMPDDLQIDTPQQVSTMYAKQGGQDVPIATFYAEDRVLVNPDQISQTVKDAAVDTEDPRFWQEGGVDVIGTIRATLATALGQDVQGGSSITQQYVKNVLVQKCEQLPAKQIDPCYQKATEISPQRKLQEIRYASAVDRRYSKAQILTGYLNIVGLGGTVYGVQTGARYYFGTDAAHLTLAQAATLVAILNSPQKLRIDRPDNPDNGAKNGYELTRERRDYVLERMYVHRSITKDQLLAAEKEPISPQITPQASGCAQAAKYDAAYYCNYVRAELENDATFGKTLEDRVRALNNDGLKIYTPLRLDLQSTAQQALSSYVPGHVDGVDLGGTDVTVEPKTGKILTMVQNTSYSDTDAPGATSVNYNTDQGYGGSTGFPTGSTFKAFTLVEWLKTGHTLQQTVSTTQHTFPFSQFHNSCMNIGNSTWSVANFHDEKPTATMTVQAATAESINSAFAKMGTQLDLCAIAQDAQAMGVHLAAAKGTFQEYPSMILGVNEISPLTMASAYAGFANGGVVCTPVGVEKIVNADGGDVPFTPSSCHQAIAPNIANTVEYALQSVLKAPGTAASANPNDGVPMFAKTGTTDGDTQNWLISSTTNYTNAIWIGNVQGQVGLEKLPLGGGVTGYDAKFAVARGLLPTLDAALGGGALPGPDQALVGTPKAAAPKAKTPAPAAAAPAPAPAPAPAAPSPQQPGQGDGDHGGGHG